MLEKDEIDELFDSVSFKMRELQSKMIKSRSAFEEAEKSFKELKEAYDEFDKRRKESF